MSYRRATLRKMPPKTRAIARLLNDLESATRRLKNQMPVIEAMESDQRALDFAIQNKGAPLPTVRAGTIFLDETDTPGEEVRR